ncbi:hypothetical protein V5O48_008183 [Marasmius crinis-equi]|uniref:DUF6924 domain-containing protein n=1 Tax=Marasmius crinis-equi TaxID=585013 RepID=A0ABR3FF22_9AGAR
MADHKVALYVSSKDVTPDLCAQIQQDFDTANGSQGPCYVRFVLGSDNWTIGLSPEEIHHKHSAEYTPESRHVLRPIVVLDERTAKDRSVVIVSPGVSAQTNEFGHAELRFVPSRAPDAVANLEIGNQTLREYEEHVDEDGIWRWWKNSTVPNPDV